MAIADTEAVYSFVGDAERILFRFTVSAPADSTAGKLLDGVRRSLDRIVRRAAEAIVTRRGAQ